jgi:hypothetical protein
MKTVTMKLTPELAEWLEQSASNLPWTDRGRSGLLRYILDGLQQAYPSGLDSTFWTRDLDRLKAQSESDDRIIEFPNK